jgi:soluble lytic murein transglycosylase-like protein
MSWRTWGVYLWGFVAGAALASYLTLSCADGHAQSPDVAYALEHASAEYGVSLGCLRNLAWRESRYQPWQTNWQGSGAAGLMQFMPGTYRWMSQQAGYGGTSPYDAWSSAHVAAWAISRGYLSHWGGRC